MAFSTREVENVANGRRYEAARYSRCDEGLFAPQTHCLVNVNCVSRILCASQSKTRLSCLEERVASWLFCRSGMVKRKRLSNYFFTEYYETRTSNVIFNLEEEMFSKMKKKKKTEKSY